MMKDRLQKQKLLQYFLSRNWYPQMEVEIFWSDSPSKKMKMVTDIDVLALAPTHMGLLKPIVGDCKTQKNQSPINRTFWLKGIMSYLHADYGFILLSKKIENDHKSLANSLNINLLSEEDFNYYTKSTTKTLINNAALCDLNCWDRYLEIPNLLPNLKPLYEYCRKNFWNETDSAIRLRHSIARIQSVRRELNPQNNSCMFIFLELCSLFSIALCDICIGTFDKFLWTTQKEIFEEDLRIQLWGGFENYNFFNQLRHKLLVVSQKEPTSNLSLPEWEIFIQVVRSCLESPLELSTVPLIIKELGFQQLQGIKSNVENPISLDYLKSLVKTHPHAVKAAILIIRYIAKSAKISEEFYEVASTQLMHLD